MQTQQSMAAHRRMRLLHWMETYQVNRTELAKRLEVGRAYISLLLIERPEGDNQKTRHFGEKAARSIEQSLGMTPGYLDGGDATHITAVTNWDRPQDLPPDSYALVPRIHVALKDGQLQDTLLALPALAFPCEWLARHKVTGQDNLRVIDVVGESMAEYLHHGDIALLDLGQTQVEDRAVYVVRFADELRIRRLEKTFSGGLRLLCDNTAFKGEELTPEQAAGTTVGRVLWRAG